jgi:hypothetical protein
LRNEHRLETSSADDVTMTAAGASQSTAPRH